MDGGATAGSADPVQGLAEPEFSRAKISVWWDLDNCHVPRGCNAHSIAHNLSKALADMNYCGAVSIHAYGDTTRLSSFVQSALCDTGVSLRHVPIGAKDASDKKILVDMLLWAVDNPAPANYLLISGDRDFSNALHSLSMRRYNILLARPQQASSILGVPAKSVWLWTSLVDGGPPLSGTDVSDQPWCETSHQQPAFKPDVSSVRNKLHTHQKAASMPDVFAVRNKLHTHQQAASMPDVSAVRNKQANGFGKTGADYPKYKAIYVPKNPSQPSVANSVDFSSGIEVTKKVACSEEAEFAKGDDQKESSEGNNMSKAPHEVFGSKKKNTSTGYSPPNAVGNNHAPPGNVIHQNRSFKRPPFQQCSVPLQSNLESETNFTSNGYQQETSPTRDSYCPTKYVRDSDSSRNSLGRRADTKPMNETCGNIGNEGSSSLPGNSVAPNVGMVGYPPHSFPGGNQRMYTAQSPYSSSPGAPYNMPLNQPFHRKGSAFGSPSGGHIRGRIPPHPNGNVIIHEHSPHLPNGNISMHGPTPPLPNGNRSMNGRITPLPNGSMNGHTPHLPNGNIRMHGNQPSYTSTFAASNPNSDSSVVGNLPPPEDEQTLIRVVLLALDHLKNEHMLPTEANITENIRYGQPIYRKIDVKKTLDAALEQHVITKQILGDNEFFVEKNQCLWKCVNPLGGNLNKHHKEMDRIHKFLTSSTGRSAIAASRCRYEAAQILKYSCLQEVALGTVLQLVDMLITQKRWIKSHPSGWKPITVTLPMA